MAKNNNNQVFERRPQDFYPTPVKPTKILLPYLKPKTKFVEPCCGDGQLIRNLEAEGHKCTFASDIEDRGYPDAAVKDGMLLTEADCKGATHIISNLPWKPNMLHPLLKHFVSLRPTWILLYTDWLFTEHPILFKGQIVKVVAVGKVKWIAESTHEGKENSGWYLFDKDHNGEIILIPKQVKARKGVLPKAPTASGTSSKPPRPKAVKHKL